MVQRILDSVVGIPAFVQNARLDVLVAQGKGLLRLTIDRWGPIATGRFSAHLADP